MSSQPSLSERSDPVIETSKRSCAHHWSVAILDISLSNQSLIKTSFKNVIVKQVTEYFFYNELI